MMNDILIHLFSTLDKWSNQNISKDMKRANNPIENGQSI